MVKKAIKNPLIEHLRVSIQNAYKTGNIPKLNDICQNIVEMLKHGEDFRRHNRHIELGSYYTETDQLTNLFSQTLRMINKTENPHLTILGRRS
jgi:hypothetical protein